jgi:GT2 family glycosyltransferase
VVDPYFGGILGARRETHGWEDAGHPHGTLMVVRRACAVDVGLFDERYFAYCEEADLAVRARRAGWEVGIVWGAEVVNPSLSLGTPIVEYLQLRNTLLLVREHFGRYKVTIRLLMAVGDTAYRWVQPSRRTAIFSARARALAMADFLRGRYGAPPLALARG